MQDLERLRVQMIHSVLCHGSFWDREPELQVDDEELLHLLAEDGDRETR